MRHEASEPIRAVGVDEMFFSTTDRRGVITGANSVFSRISRYPQAQLLGSPHNIIRNSNVPGGVFHLMWEALNAGRPFAGYVESLAHDGYGYWVFATITPLEDGFLSVRTAPCVDSLWSKAVQIYERVLRLENAHRERGMSKREAAELGAREIVAMLGEAGFPNYEAFQLTALPAEVSTRSSMSRLNMNRPAGQDDVSRILNTNRVLDREINQLLGRLDGFLRLAEALHAGSDEAGTSVHALREVADTASRASATVADSAPVLARAGSAMSVLGSQVTGSIDNLITELIRIRWWILELRFRIALARLQGDMVASFAIEVLDGTEGTDGLAYIPVLCRALNEGTEAVVREMDQANARLQGVAEYVESVGGQLREFQRFLSTWRIMVPKFGLSRQLDPYVAPIDAQLQNGHNQIARVRSLAARCLDEVQPFEREPLMEPIREMMLTAQSVKRGQHVQSTPSTRGISFPDASFGW